MSNKPRRKDTPKPPSHSEREADRKFQLDLKRTELWESVIRAASTGVLILCMMGPLWIMRPMVIAFAGKTTSVNVTMALSLTLAFGLSTAVMTFVLRDRNRHIRELTERNDQLARGQRILQKRLRDNRLDDSLPAEVIAATVNPETLKS